MRRRTKAWRVEKILVFIILASGFSVMGTTYGMWTDRLTVQEKLKTGDFSMRLGEETPWSALLSYEDGEEILEVEDTEIEKQIKSKGKAAETYFLKGLPADGLVDGAYVDMRIPLESVKKENHIQIKTKDSDEMVLGQPIKAKADASALLVDGVAYEAEAWTEGFEQDISFCVGTGIIQEESAYEAVVRLQVEEKSAHHMEKYPGELAITAEEFGQLLPATDLEKCDLEVAPANREMIGDNSGVVVLYKVKVPIFMDQKEAEEEPEESLLDNSIQSYAYWTDRVDVEIEIPVVYGVDVQILEETEGIAKEAEEE